MSDKDLIKRGDALNACYEGCHWDDIQEKITNIPAVPQEMSAREMAIEVRARVDNVISHIDEFWEYCSARPDITNASKQRAMRAFIDKYCFEIASPSLLFGRGVKYEWDWLFKPERSENDGDV